MSCATLKGEPSLKTYFRPSNHCESPINIASSNLTHINYCTRTHRQQIDLKDVPKNSVSSSRLLHAAGQRLAKAKAENDAQSRERERITTAPISELIHSKMNSSF